MRATFPLLLLVASLLLGLLAVVLGSSGLLILAALLFGATWLALLLGFWNGFSGLVQEVRRWEDDQQP